MVEPRQVPPPLLFLRDVEEELDHTGAASIQMVLEGVDVLVPSLPKVRTGLGPGWEMLWGQQFGVHPDDQDLLVVRAVEDPDPPPLGQYLAATPEEVVAELLGRGLLEGVDL